MSDWTLDELVVAALAHGFDDDIRAFNGAASFVPVAALQLARATHAPGLTWVASSIAVDPHPPAIPETSALPAAGGPGGPVVTEAVIRFPTRVQVRDDEPVPAGDAGSRATPGCRRSRHSRTPSGGKSAVRLRSQEAAVLAPVARGCRSPGNAATPTARCDARVEPDTPRRQVYSGIMKTT